MRILYLLLCSFVCLITSGSYAQNRTAVEYNWDVRMVELGLTDVCFWEPAIQCFLVYTTADNFMKKPLYNTKLTRAWLHPHAAMKLIHAQEILQQERPDLSLLIYDAARPIEVQRIMADWAKRTNNTNFVADPSKGGGQHNYGMAVDVTLVDDQGEWLPMGTPFDFFGPEAYTDKEDVLLKQRRISPSEYKNRQLLRRVMEDAGFTSITSEWWHFNACSSEEAKKRYKLIDK